MLSTTPILYCKRAALHHVPDTRPIDPWALPPVPLSSLAEPRLLALGALRRPRGYFTLKVSAMSLSVPLYYSPDFSIIAHTLDPGRMVWFKLYNLTMCLAPPLLCARGVPGNVLRLSVALGDRPGHAGPREEGSILRSTWHGPRRLRPAKGRYRPHSSQSRALSYVTLRRHAQESENA